MNPDAPSGRGRVTLKDVARRAGVSISCVSKALRGASDVSPGLRERIRILAQRMGYRPDPALSALVAYRAGRRLPAFHGVLAFLSGGGQTPAGMEYTRILAQSVRGDARALGYEVETHGIPPDRRGQLALARVLEARGIRGWLLLPFPFSVAELHFRWESVHVVHLMGESAGIPACAVVNNHFQGMRTALSQLFRRGYRRPGLVIGRKVLHPFGTDWMAAYEHALRHEFRASAETFVFQDRIDETPDEFISWVRGARIDALIYCGADWIRQRLREMGLRIPDELGLCCLDLARPDSESAGIYQDRPFIARMAVRHLHSMLIHAGLDEVRRPTCLQVDGLWNDGATLRPPRLS